MGKYFGTDGFRGEANIGLTPRHAFLVGRFLGWYYGQKHTEDGERCRIAIGKDTRRSSYMLEDALSAGLTASGADVYLLHVTPTPSVSHVVRTENFGCGIMISASHNPFYDNGIKLINGNGEKMEESVILEIEKWIDGEPEALPLAKREGIGRTIDFAAGRNRYIGYLISLATRSFKNQRIALDCANGSASSIAKNVFDALGNLVDGDLILYICGKYMKDCGQLEHNRVVTTVMSNFGLYKAFDRAGISYVKTQVGDKYVYENMQAEGNCLGGEQSGHIIFSKHETTGDGMVTALKVMEVLMETKQPLSKLASEVTIYPQLLRSVRVRDKEAAQKDPKVLAEVARQEEKLESEGRILLRASGTEPLIRVMAEAATDALCAQCVDAIIEVMEQEKWLLP